MKSFIGTAEKGIQWLSKQETKKLFTINPLTGKRSSEQNRLYWFYLELVEESTGTNKEELHEYFKRVFLPVKLSRIKLPSETIEYQRPSSTTELTKEEFSKYMDRIAVMTEIPIPNIYEL